MIACEQVSNCMQQNVLLKSRQRTPTVWSILASQNVWNTLVCIRHIVCVRQMMCARHIQWLVGETENAMQILGQVPAVNIKILCVFEPTHSLCNILRSTGCCHVSVVTHIWHCVCSQCWSLTHAVCSLIGSLHDRVPTVCAQNEPKTINQVCMSTTHTTVQHIYKAVAAWKACNLLWRVSEFWPECSATAACAPILDVREMLSKMCKHGMFWEEFQWWNLAWVPTSKDW